MFTKILIANRGEISCRISRTAHQLGVHTVAVYSGADAHAMHVQHADEAVLVGPAPSRESYLCGDKIIAAAQKTGAQAIHPGYGFLSENAGFAQACRDAGLVFIGPSPAAITAMGSKSGAKALMEKAGVPLIPGYHGDNQDDDFLLAQACGIGFPVLLKASAGGGGKGMREVHNEADFFDALHAAQREASNAFNDQHMLIEKLLVEPRHVEVQVLADRFGHAVYVFDRDCSIQRRHQKVVEEAPAPGLSDALRAAMGDAAVRAAKAIAYEGAGTLEFLVDKNGQFFFMEMNTRLQVEHPVSELISGLDLVEWQLRVASGEPLTFTQNDLAIRGHAIEVRLYAEDPATNFLPSTGTLREFFMPQGDGVRVDTGYKNGDAVSVYYDPMMAKVIAWGETREQAAQRLLNALQQVRIAGVKHNTAFLIQVLAHTAFKNAQLNTHFIDEHQRDLLDSPDHAHTFLLAAALSFLHSAALEHADKNSPWSALQGFRIGAPDAIPFQLSINGTIHALNLTPIDNATLPQQFGYKIGERSGVCALQSDANHDANIAALSFSCDGVQRRFYMPQKKSNENRCDIFSGGQHIEVLRVIHAQADNHNANARGYKAPMNGRIVSVNVKAGDAVKENDTLLVMEAMKMEHRIRAHSDGVIAVLDVQAGELVSESQVLVQLE